MLHTQLRRRPLAVLKDNYRSYGVLNLAFSGREILFMWKFRVATLNHRWRLTLWYSKVHVCDATAQIPKRRARERDRRMSPFSSLMINGLSSLLPRVSVNAPDFEPCECSVRISTSGRRPEYHPTQID